LWRSLKNAGDNRDRKFVLPEKVGQSLPKSLKTCYPRRPPIIPNFIEIGQTSLEKSVTKIGPRTKIFFVTDGQKHDYLSRDSQHARGTTKNPAINLTKARLAKNGWISNVPELKSEDKTKQLF